MKTATALALLAVGAILTFAVNAAIPGVNLQVAGLIVMLTGVAGLLIPARTSGWLRRRIVLRGPNGPVVEEADDHAYPSDVMRDPATLAARILQDARAAADDPRMLPYLGRTVSTSSRTWSMPRRSPRSRIRWSARTSRASGTRAGQACAGRAAPAQAGPRIRAGPGTRAGRAGAGPRAASRQAAGGLPTRRTSMVMSSRRSFMLNSSTSVRMAEHTSVGGRPASEASWSASRSSK